MPNAGPPPAHRRPTAGVPPAYRRPTSNSEIIDNRPTSGPPPAHHRPTAGPPPKRVGKNIIKERFGTKLLIAHLELEENTPWHILFHHNISQG